jgi:hypothetical protein
MNKYMKFMSKKWLERKLLRKNIYKYSCNLGIGGGKIKNGIKKRKFKYGR